MPKHLIKKIQIFFEQHSKTTNTLMAGMLIGAIFASGFYASYLFFTSVPQGVSFQGIDLSGWNRNQATSFVKDFSDQFSHQTLQVNLLRGGESIAESFSFSSLGLQHDVSRILQNLFEQRYDGIHGAAIDVPPIINGSESALQKIYEALRVHEQEMKNAELVFQNGRWALSAEQIGYQLKGFLEMADLHTILKQEGPQKTWEISLEVLQPSVTTAQLSPLFERIQTLMTHRVEWTVGDKTLSFDLGEYPDAILVRDGKVIIDGEKIGAFIADWAPHVEQVPGSVIVGEPEEKERGYLKAHYQGTFEKGKKVDQEKMTKALYDALAGDRTVTSIEVPLMEVSPAVEMAGVGQLSLLSQGRSSFTLGNIPQRVHNIRLGLSKYDGVVIPQGAEFSFNQILGKVTYVDGWEPAGAIFGGGGVRDVPGGGLCQVSTTVYRAAVHSGLSVTKRKPHSLDVPYYHQYGYGIDATIYPPSGLDLKFINDTPGVIFIHAYTDEEREEAFVEFYGIDDGRQIELTQVENRKVILPEQTVVNEKLAPAEFRVIQAGRVGRYVEWEWKIKKRDGSEEVRAIESLYPAQASVVEVPLSTNF